MRVQDITNKHLADYINGALSRINPQIEDTSLVVLPVELGPKFLALCEDEIAEYIAANPCSVYDFYEIPSHCGDFQPDFPLLSLIDIVLETYGA